MTTSISDVRIAPVGEDLTLPEGRLEILRGMEKMYRVDKAYGAAQDFALGEWACLHADGKAYRAGASPVAATYLVFGGTDRYDSKATGQVTLVMASQVIAKTTQYDIAPTYLVGSYLTVKSRGVGASNLTLWTSGEIAVAKVVEVGVGYLVYETMSPVKVA